MLAAATTTRSASGNPPAASRRIELLDLRAIGRSHRSCRYTEPPPWRPVTVGLITASVSADPQGGQRWDYVGTYLDGAATRRRGDAGVAGDADAAAVPMQVRWGGTSRVSTVGHRCGGRAGGGTTG